MAHLPGSGKAVDLWPGVVYLIVSLAEPELPLIRAFRIEEGRIIEEPLRVTD